MVNRAHLRKYTNGQFHGVVLTNVGCFIHQEGCRVQNVLELNLHRELLTVYGVLARCFKVYPSEFILGSGIVVEFIHNVLSIIQEIVF